MKWREKRAARTCVTRQTLMQMTTEVSSNGNVGVGWGGEMRGEGRHKWEGRHKGGDGSGWDTHGEGNAMGGEGRRDGREGKWRL